MQGMIGFGLAGGAGVRAYPLTLKAPGYVRSKAVIKFLGRPVVEWLVNALKAQGLHDYLMVVLGKENRYQVKRVVGYGERFGVRIGYSPVRYDDLNTGSADAVMQNLAGIGRDAPVLVFPTDSLIEADLPAMLQFHLERRAVLTVGVHHLPAKTIAGLYGLVLTDQKGRVVRFLEKPGWQEMKLALGGASLSPEDLLATSAGFYLLDRGQIGPIADRPEVRAMRGKACDIGADFLPWLVEHGYPVYAFAAGQIGDLGNIPAYIATMRQALAGAFSSLTALMGEPFDGERRIWISEETLRSKDASGRDLEERMKRGEIKVKGRVRIGRFVSLGAGVELEECNVEDDCYLEGDVRVSASSLGEGTMVGAGARLVETVTGIMVRIDSRPEAPVSLEGLVALGDEVCVGRGIELRGPLIVYPNVVIPDGCVIPPEAEIRSSQQALQYVAGAAGE